MSGSTILLTGVHGFIGARLAHRLGGMDCQLHTAGRRPGGAKSRDVRHWTMDLSRPEQVSAVVKRVNPDFVLHAATCRLEDDWLSLSRVNIVGECALIEACSAVGVKRMVALGASLELFARSTSLYAASRKAGAVMALDLADRLGQSYSRVRTGYVYGTTMRSNGFFPVAIKAGLTNSELALAPSHLRRNYVNVDDVVEACLTALNRTSKDADKVDLLANQTHSAQEVIQLLEEILGCQMMTCINPALARPWDDVDWSEIQAGSGDLMAQRSLGDGLAEMVAVERARHGY